MDDKPAVRGVRCRVVDEAFHFAHPLLHLRRHSFHLPQFHKDLVGFVRDLIDLLVGRIARLPLPIVPLIELEDFLPPRFSPLDEAVQLAVLGFEGRFLPFDDVAPLHR